VNSCAPERKAVPAPQVVKNNTKTNQVDKSTSVMWS